MFEVVSDRRRLCNVGKIARDDGVRRKRGMIDLYGSNRPSFHSPEKRNLRGVEYGVALFPESLLKDRLGSIN